MTVSLFISLFTIGSMVSSLLTEALKKAFKSIATNIIALVDAVVVGCFGTLSAYVLMGVEWSLTNLVCLFLMAFCIWIGSMVGYDIVKTKVLQTISQIKG